MSGGSIGDMEKYIQDLPSDVSNFIYRVTLFLQKHHTAHTADQKNDMFQEAYKLYVRYEVENDN